MVFFTCDKCGESLKKNQVQKHHSWCRSYSYSCLDCQNIFDIQTYGDHLKCISENQKYGGKNYVEKVQKGEVKQNAWIELVERAMQAVKDPTLKALFKDISSFSNIPRKEAKFINFLTNSFGCKNRSLCQQAWNAIAEETKKIKEENDAQIKINQSTSNILETENDKNHPNYSKDSPTNVDKNDDAQANGPQTNIQLEDLEVENWKWKKAIKRKIRESGGQIKLKKLRKALYEDFIKIGGQESDFEYAFDEKLHKCGVQINGKLVLLG